jgi:hypothetical protein
LGAISLVTLIFFFDPPPRTSTQKPLKEKIINLDLPGFALFVPTIVMLLLALNWGGTVYPWKSARIIGLFCGAGVLAIVFILCEWHQQEKASIPLSLFRNRAASIAFALAFLVFGAMQVVVYMMPIWFQVILDVSPTQSGINLLPNVGGNILMLAVCGILGKSICSF